MLWVHMSTSTCSRVFWGFLPGKWGCTFLINPEPQNRMFPPPFPQQSLHPIVFFGGSTFICLTLLCGTLRSVNLLSGHKLLRREGRHGGRQGASTRTTSCASQDLSENRGPPPTKKTSDQKQAVSLSLSVNMSSKRMPSKKRHPFFWGGILLDHHLQDNFEDVTQKNKQTKNKHLWPLWLLFSPTLSFQGSPCTFMLGVLNSPLNDWFLSWFTQPEGFGPNPILRTPVG